MDKINIKVTDMHKEEYSTRQNLEVARNVLELLSNGENLTLDYYISEVINMLDGIIAHHESMESKGQDYITETLEAIKELKHE